MALDPPGFVTTNGDRFWCDGRPYGRIGVNWFGAVEGPAGHGSTAMLDTAFGWCQDNGIEVVRAMAFYNGTNPGGTAHQPTRGNFNPLQNGRRWLDGLDLVIKKATDYNLRLILPLTNGTPSSFGGIDQWVTWGISEGLFAGPLSNTTRKQFYENTTIHTWLQAAYASIIGRTNALTSVAYVDDPAILGWELANEPEQPDENPPGSSVARWIAWRDIMSAYIKSLDSNHLVFTGGTGFDNTGTGGATGYTNAAVAYSGQNWPFNGIKGLSFTNEGADSNIDAHSVHIYMAASHAMLDSAGPLYISEKAGIAATAGKPLLIGEFGSVASNRAVNVYRPWLAAVNALTPGRCIALIWEDRKSVV